MAANRIFPAQFVSEQDDAHIKKWVKYMQQLAPRVNPKEYEADIYKFWLENELFHADENSAKPPYAMVIPPPNVTGSLHIGHALNSTLQDILLRYHKLKGFETIWIPGTDHAGIATQNVVERRLAAEGKSRKDLGRERFIEEVWKWKATSGGNIIHQLKSIGAACDWERERFTMDDELSRAVRKVFVTLYKEGLIYRANYMVNWCVRCHTALSDLEVEFEERQDFLYHMRYPLADGSGEVEIATTRPETYLGDTAVAVNPEYERYQHLIGQKVRLPFIDREIPIIGDSYVDMTFGTGCLKVTPGADPNDFQIGRKHGLEEIAAMDESGIVTIGEFAGMERFRAREAVINRFKEAGLMGEIKPLTHSVGHCYRCGTVVEPMISLQWFVKVAPLAAEAINAVKDGRTRIIPKMWEASYFEWMENIRDWCISRQIWWGHRIPAWHCRSCGYMTVSETDVDVCEVCGSANIEQETDVLDTWFSSALWPFSTQGWPDKTKTLEKFYPTSVLVTAFDILFFWVARMMMMGLKFMGDVPFKDVYIHALVRDSEGQKMSKMKGNVIDPLVMTDKYGADAMRFALTAFAAQGRDIRMSEERIEGYRNFVNKIWNASRFIFMNLEGWGGSRQSDTRDEDKWIISKLSFTIKAVEKALAGYNFNEAAAALYQFFWNQFCDWYVELIKDRIFKDDAKEAAQATAAYVLEKALICLHPFMPFVTEHIWQKLTGGKTIMKAAFPESSEVYPEAEKRIDDILELIDHIRKIRGEYKVNPGQMVDAYVITNEVNIGTLFTDKKPLVEKMARAKLIFAGSQPDKSASQVSRDYTVCLPLEGLIDSEQELARLNKELAALEKDYKLYSGKLANERYLEKASPEIIAKDRAKAADLEKQMALVKESINAIK